jgi:hypothetical protein
MKKAMHNSPGRRRVLKSANLRQAEWDIQRVYGAMYFRDHPIVIEERINWTHVYQLVDPRDGAVFYVGKGGPYRLREHEYEADCGLNTPKCIRIREIWASGLQVEFRTVGLFVKPWHNEQALRFEQGLIKEGGASLTNNQPAVTWRSQNGRSQ